MRNIEKRLRERIKDLEKKLSETETDLEKHRRFWVDNLRTAIHHLGEGKSLSMVWYVERLSKHFNNVTYWWWY